MPWPPMPLISSCWTVCPQRVERSPKGRFLALSHFHPREFPPSSPSRITMSEKTKHNYDESKIKTLSSLEHIRLRTGMYIGRIGTGAHPSDGGSWKIWASVE